MDEEMPVSTQDMELWACPKQGQDLDQPLPEIYEM